MPPTTQRRNDPAREAAHRRLESLARKFPDLPIDPLDTEGLDQRDAAFAHAIVDAAVRRWITLAYLVEQGLRQPFDTLEPRVKAALLAGAAQMLLLDRVPPRAAIFESVEWAKRSRRVGAGGLVNAALRRLKELVALDNEDTPDARPRKREHATDKRDEIPLADGGALVLRAEALPLDKLERLGVATSHPVELLRIWSRAMPLREVRRIAIHGVATPPVILNTAHAHTPVPAEVTSPHGAPGHHVFTGSRLQLMELLASRQDVWVQDPASSLAVESVSDLKPRLVIDACAGKGTKTRQLAAAFPDAHIIATDVDTARRRALKRAFHRSEQVAVVAPETLVDHAGRADLVLLDVPCSNTGVLSRRVEARYRAALADKADELVNVQRQIIADAIRLLAPGGAILYSTCSLDPRENEEQLDWASRWHSLDATRVHRRLPSGGPGEPPDRYSDGSFAGLLA